MPIDCDRDEGFASAMAKLAEGDLQNARRLMRRAADEGHGQAIGLYASFVEHGVGGRANPTKAMVWFERSADLGNLESCIRLAQWNLALGREAKAKFWLERAGRDPRASFMATALYAQSRSVRATRMAKGALFAAALHRERLSEIERADLARLQADFLTRTPDAIWAPNNRHNLAWRNQQRR